MSTPRKTASPRELLVPYIAWLRDHCRGDRQQQGPQHGGVVLRRVLPPVDRVVIVACLANLAEQDARRAHQERVNRRLREQLAQERMKGESFRRYTSARLDTHDGELGVDTRTATALPGVQNDPARYLESMADGGAIPVAGATPQAAQPAQLPGQGDVWYYLVGSQKVGPLGLTQMVVLAQSQGIVARTVVWRQGMPDWAPADQVAELKPYLTG